MLTVSSLDFYLHLKDPGSADLQVLKVRIVPSVLSCVILHIWSSFKGPTRYSKFFHIQALQCFWWSFMQRPHLQSISQSCSKPFRTRMLAIDMLILNLMVA